MLDTNVFIDYLRTGLHAGLVAGETRHAVRFLSSVVLLELRLGADTPRRVRAVAKIGAAFPASRQVAPAPDLYERAGALFRKLHGAGEGLRDRLGPVNDVLIALTAWRMGATVITSNTADFCRIATHLPGLLVAAPDES
ncbi:MAG TPA: type II toxin-antitoxin system VapC family toxin [Polyangia bacterium]